MGFRGKRPARLHCSQPPPHPPPRCSEWLQPAPYTPRVDKSPGTPAHCQPVEPLPVPPASLSQPPASLLLNVGPHVFLQTMCSSVLLGTGLSNSATCPEPGFWNPVRLMCTTTVSQRHPMPPTRLPSQERKPQPPQPYLSQSIPASGVWGMAPKTFPGCQRPLPRKNKPRGNNVFSGPPAQAPGPHHTKNKSPGVQLLQAHHQCSISNSTEPGQGNLSPNSHQPYFFHSSPPRS